MSTPTPRPMVFLDESADVPEAVWSQPLLTAAEVADLTNTAHAHNMTERELVVQAIREWFDRHVKVVEGTL